MFLDHFSAAETYTITSIRALNGRPSVKVCASREIRETGDYIIYSEGRISRLLVTRSRLCIKREREIYSAERDRDKNEQSLQKTQFMFSSKIKPHILQLQNQNF